MCRGTPGQLECRRAPDGAGPRGPPRAIRAAGRPPPPPPVVRMASSWPLGSRDKNKEVNYK